MSAFKVGDKVRHRHRWHAQRPGIVYQIEGGRDGDLTEVFWPDNDQALWHNTNNLTAATHCPNSGLLLTRHGEGLPGSLSCDVCDCFGFPAVEAERVAEETEK